MTATATNNVAKEGAAKQEATKEKHELRHKLATEFSGAIVKQREDIKSLRNVLASIENKLIRAPATPTCRTR